MSKKIVDCFCFFNELDILKIRLEELYPVVSNFILVESTKTQSFKNKPLYFEENKKYFSPFLDKITHIIVKDAPFNLTQPWLTENHQRECISRGFKDLNLTKEDVVLISDVDEIPRAEFVQRLNNVEDLIVFGMTYNVYYLDLIMSGKTWRGTVAVNGETALNDNTHRLIKLRDNIPESHLNSICGWHLGYQGGKGMVFNKYFACIEPFNKNDIPSKEAFDKVYDERIKDGGSFIFCDNLNRTDLKLEKIDKKMLPKYIQENQDKFKEHFLPE